MASNPEWATNVFGVRIVETWPTGSIAFYLVAKYSVFLVKPWHALHKSQSVGLHRGRDEPLINEEN